MDNKGKTKNKRTKTTEQAHLFFSMRLSEVGNSTLSKLKGYKNLGSTIMKKKCTRTLKIDNYGLKFQKKGKDGFCNIRKDAYSCYELNVCALPSIHQLSLSLCDGSSVEPLPV